MLTAVGVSEVIDIRTVPRSRTNPQYNADVAASSFMQFGLEYSHSNDLGGLRPRRDDIDPAVNGLWRNQSFHNYADYALTEPFALALNELVERAEQHPVAVMCAEAVWWRCHRRIVADYLVARGRRVDHIMGLERTEPARLTPGAVVVDEMTVTYPAPAAEAD